MRLDHIAYRVADRNAAAAFFVSVFGYRVVDEFFIKHDNGECAKCFALDPPEKKDDRWRTTYGGWESMEKGDYREYHQAPQIFVSDGTPESIVGKWVARRGGVGGIHHLAYEVEDVGLTMHLWRKAGYAEFTTDGPISNINGLTQCFTKPHPITGVVYEFIKRGENNKGFNIENVKDLMESTDA